MKGFRPLQYYWKNWWLLPIVWTYGLLFFISYYMEEAAIKMNSWTLDQLKSKKRKLY